LGFYHLRFTQGVGAGGVPVKSDGDHLYLLWLLFRADYAWAVRFSGAKRCLCSLGGSVRGKRRAGLNLSDSGVNHIELLLI
jgi:hypothetical protein